MEHIRSPSAYTKKFQFQYIHLNPSISLSIHAFQLWVVVGQLGGANRDEDGGGPGDLTNDLDLETGFFRRLFRMIPRTSFAFDARCLAFDNLDCVRLPFPLDFLFSETFLLRSTAASFSAHVCLDFCVIS